MIAVRNMDGVNDYALVVDDCVYTTDQADVHLVTQTMEVDDRYGFNVKAKSQDVNSQVLAQLFSDIPSDVWILEVKADEESYTSKTEDRAPMIDGPRILNFPQQDSLRISFNTDFDFDSWKGNWSIGEYVSELKNTFAKKGLAEAELMPHGMDSPADGFRIVFFIEDREAVIGEKLSECQRLVNEIFELTEASLVEEIDSDTVVVHFSFPSEVKVACEQYLLYFVQFLEDLGVEATAKLHHEAGEVLFSVTPTDKDEALDKIRAALDTYLRLAASPVDSASVLSTEIEVQRLSANIQHLQGQLTLAHAVLQAKDAAIQLQQTTIAQQRQMLTGDIVLESMKDVTPRPKDAEEVFGGLAEITKYEGKGFNLNLPEAFRRLRKMFGEKKGGG
jgi:hypothetical protein